MTAQQTIGAYRVIRKLGAGGMGAVFEALHPQLERRVALKLLHPEYARNPDAVTRFFNEARAANRIEHPGIVQVSDSGRTPEGAAYIVMEYLPGETLGRWLKGLTEAAPVAALAERCWQVACALSAAHQKGIVHRDLKPDNIMLVPDPVSPGGQRVKILDFGIAKLVERTPDSAEHTDARAIMGTPSYMAPEQCRGSSEITPKVDVYSLGVILYLGLSGRLPFESASTGELLGMHLFATPQPLDYLSPRVPQALIALTHALLRKSPEARPSMAEVADALACEQVAQPQRGTSKARLLLSLGAGALVSMLTVSATLALRRPAYFASAARAVPSPRTVVTSALPPAPTVLLPVTTPPPRPISVTLPTEVVPALEGPGATAQPAPALPPAEPAHSRPRGRSGTRPLKLSSETVPPARALKPIYED